MRAVRRIRRPGMTLVPVFGLYVFYWKDVPSGPAITLVLAGLLGMVLVLPSPRR